MAEKTDVTRILEACQKSGPMDENLVRGNGESVKVNDDEYYADAMNGTKQLQFSNDGNTDKEK